MNRSLKNTAAVLLATVLTAMAIFAGVQFASVVGRRRHQRNVPRAPATSSWLHDREHRLADLGHAHLPAHGLHRVDVSCSDGLPPGQ